MDRHGTHHTLAVGLACMLIVIAAAGCVGPRSVADPPTPRMPDLVPLTTPTMPAPPRMTPLTPDFPRFSHQPSWETSTASSNQEPAASSGSAGGDPSTTASMGSPQPSQGQEQPPVENGYTTDVMVEWRDAASGAVVTSAPPWTLLTLNVTFKLHFNGTAALEVWGEIPQAYDRRFAVGESRSLTPGVYTFEGTFETVPDNVTSFVPAISVNGGLTWYADGPPDRLALDMPRGQADVTLVEWLVSDAPVSSAAVGTAVVARVTVGARGGDFVDELRLEVRADVAGTDDHTTATLTERVEIVEGSPQTFDIPFVVEGGSGIRGHYIHAESQGRFFCHGWVEFVSGAECDGLKLDFQHEGYPPRLARS